MQETGKERRKRISLFLESIDTSHFSWKEQIIDYFDVELSKKETGKDRLATFSVGDSLEDEIDELVIDSLEGKELKDEGTQTNEFPEEDGVLSTTEAKIEELEKLWKKGEYVCPGDALRLVRVGKAKIRECERLGLMTAMELRRELASSQQNFRLKDFPHRNYDYKYVAGACCENVIGYTPIPTGVAGPLTITDSENPSQSRTVFVPMATTEGTLIASTNRGCSVLQKAGGVDAHILSDKMTRAPVIRFPRVASAVKFCRWIDNPENYQLVKEKFESTSGYCRLQKITTTPEGNDVHIKFFASTGDAMGMNMISKACSAAMKLIKMHFPEADELTLSGNTCSDKKAAAINVIQGRGKSVVADCVIPARLVQEILKTSPQRMVKVARAKLSDGSSLACTVGGNNAHAANIVAAIFLATGQDAAQVVSSSMCSTKMSVVEGKGDLHVSVTMPCIEVGTVGGGTILGPQTEMLRLLGCAGKSSETPGDNAKFLAKVIATTVLAGELSLMAALCTDTLVASHMKFNRSQLQFSGLLESPKPSMPTVTLAPYRMKKNSERASCSNIL